MLFTILLVVQVIIGVGLVTVILVQRSEGGGLTGGGSPAGLMSARGAADFLTRSTAVLATLFVVLSIVLAALAVKTSTGRTIDTTLDRSAPAAPQPADSLAPAANGAQPGQQPAQAPQPAPAPNDPLAGAAKK